MPSMPTFTLSPGMLGSGASYNATLNDCARGGPPRTSFVWRSALDAPAEPGGSARTEDPGALHAASDERRKEKDRFHP